MIYIQHFRKNVRLLRVFLNDVMMIGEPMETEKTRRLHGNEDDRLCWSVDVHSGLTNAVRKSQGMEKSKLIKYEMRLLREENGGVGRISQWSVYMYRTGVGFSCTVSAGFRELFISEILDN